MSRRESPHDVAELPDSIERHFGLIELLDDEMRTQLRGELESMWENPEHYAEEGHGGMESELMYALRLGVAFGVEYEKAYPTQRRDEWPVPLEERDGY